MGTTDATALLHKFKSAVRQDPKKACILTVLGLVLLIMVGRQMVGGKPAAARAAATATNTLTSGKSVSGFTSAKSTGSARTSGSRGNGHELSERANNVNQKIREWMSDPVKPVTRNLFTVKLEYFPVDGSRPAMSAKTAADGEFWGRLEKSLMIQADQRDKRDILLANYKSEASRLRLDSIIMGDHPKAMIDGKLVAEGDVVAQFRVLKIEPRRITIEREGIRLEIQMK